MGGIGAQSAGIHGDTRAAVEAHTCSARQRLINHQACTGNDVVNFDRRAIVGAIIMMIVHLQGAIVQTADVIDLGIAQKANAL